MPEVLFLYSFSGCSWYVPCRVISKLDSDEYLIEFDDPMLIEWSEPDPVTLRKVSASSLMFPSFADTVM